MTFTKFYPKCDRTVKGPQIYDAVLRHNGSMYIYRTSFSPAVLLIENILSEGFPHAVERMFCKSFKSDSDEKNYSKVGTNLGVFPFHFFQIYEKYIRQLGSNLCTLFLDFKEYGLKEAQRNLSQVGNTL